MEGYRRPGQSEAPMLSPRGESGPRIQRECWETFGKQPGLSCEGAAATLLLDTFG